MRYTLLVLALGACGGMDGSSPTDRGADAGGSPTVEFQPIAWQTPHTSLHADSLEIDAEGEAFTAAVPMVHVSGDFVGSNGYTTLESIWEEHGVEMRLFVYLHTDGVSWWSDEIRTYGGPSDDWIYNYGDFFRSPIGTPFTGDFNAGNVHMHDVNMASFLAPDCGGAAYTLLPTDLIVDVSSVGAGYALAVTLLDNTCSPAVPPAGATFAWSVDDPAIASATPQAAGTFSASAGFLGLAAGSTTATVTLTGADGTVLATLREPVVVDASWP